MIILNMSDQKQTGSRGADVRLPLRIDTPDDWGTRALQETCALLNDHAHLEKKAAQNALELLHRWPEPTPPDNWVVAMTAVARDEVEHLALVVRLLSRRGGRLTKSHSNRYAAALRGLVRGGGLEATIDRLMISALIEARSCERFEILARIAEDEPLAKIYRGLWASERGHYLSFIDLARQVAALEGSAMVEHVESRWDEMLDAEAAVIQKQAPGPRMHAWVE
ncbi:MAG: tRNA-(ms[2]io[6]A)-hydroxylase [Planctomycetaceae bacterium]|nr:tRNA-(ms[2]io[6]A)-hydroxylase [Planctomycetaceae bacterium]